MVAIWPLPYFSLIDSESSERKICECVVCHTMQFDGQVKQFRGNCCLHLQGRRWRQEVFTKPSYLSTKLQVDMSKNTVILILCKIFKSGVSCVAVADISADVTF